MTMRQILPPNVLITSMDYQLEKACQKYVERISNYRLIDVVKAPGSDHKLAYFQRQYAGSSSNTHAIAEVLVIASTGAISEMTV